MIKTKTPNGYKIDIGSRIVTATNDKRIDLTKIASDFGVSIDNKHNVTIKEALSLTSDYIGLNSFINVINTALSEEVTSVQNIYANAIANPQPDFVDNDKVNELEEQNAKLISDNIKLHTDIVKDKIKKNEIPQEVLDVLARDSHTPQATTATISEAISILKGKNDEHYNGLIESLVSIESNLQNSMNIGDLNKYQHMVEREAEIANTLRLQSIQQLHDISEKYNDKFTEETKLNNYIVRHVDLDGELAKNNAYKNDPHKNAYAPYITAVDPALFKYSIERASHNLWDDPDNPGHPIRNITTNGPPAFGPTPLSDPGQLARLRYPFSLFEGICRLRYEELGMDAAGGADAIVPAAVYDESDPSRFIPEYRNYYNLLELITPEEEANSNQLIPTIFPTTVANSRIADTHDETSFRNFYEGAGATTRPAVPIPTKLLWRNPVLVPGGPAVEIYSYSLPAGLNIRYRTPSNPANRLTPATFYKAKKVAQRAAHINKAATPNLYYNCIFAPTNYLLPRTDANYGLVDYKAVNIDGVYYTYANLLKLYIESIFIDFRYKLVIGPRAPVVLTNLFTPEITALNLYTRNVDIVNLAYLSNQLYDVFSKATYLRTKTDISRHATFQNNIRKSISFIKDVYNNITGKFAKYCASLFVVCAIKGILHVLLKELRDNYVALNPNLERDYYRYELLLTVIRMIKDIKDSSDDIENYYDQKQFHPILDNNVLPGGGSFYSYIYANIGNYKTEDIKTLCQYDKYFDTHTRVNASIKSIIKSFPFEQILTTIISVNNDHKGFGGKFNADLIRYLDNLISEIDPAAPVDFINHAQIYTHPNEFINRIFNDVTGRGANNINIALNTINITFKNEVDDLQRIYEILSTHVFNYDAQHHTLTIKDIGTFGPNVNNFIFGDQPNNSSRGAPYKLIDPVILTDTPNMGFISEIISYDINTVSTNLDDCINYIIQYSQLCDRELNKLITNMSNDLFIASIVNNYTPAESPDNIVTFVRKMYNHVVEIQSIYNKIDPYFDRLMNPVLNPKLYQNVANSSILEPRPHYNGNAAASNRPLMEGIQIDGNTPLSTIDVDALDVRRMNIFNPAATNPICVKINRKNARLSVIDTGHGIGVNLNNPDPFGALNAPGANHNDIMNVGNNILFGPSPIYVEANERNPNLPENRSSSILNIKSYGVAAVPDPKDALAPPNSGGTLPVIADNIITDLPEAQKPNVYLPNGLRGPVAQADPDGRIHGLQQFGAIVGPDSYNGVPENGGDFGERLGGGAADIVRMGAATPIDPARVDGNLSDFYNDNIIETRNRYMFIDSVNNIRGMMEYYGRKMETMLRDLEETWIRLNGYGGGGRRRPYTSESTVKDIFTNREHLATIYGINPIPRLPLPPGTNTLPRSGVNPIMRSPFSMVDYFDGSDDVHINGKDISYPLNSIISTLCGEKFATDAEMDADKTILIAALTQMKNNFVEYYRGLGLYFGVSKYFRLLHVLYEQGIYMLDMIINEVNVLYGLHAKLTTALIETNTELIYDNLTGVIIPLINTPRANFKASISAFLDNTYANLIKTEYHHRCINIFYKSTFNLYKLYHQSLHLDKIADFLGIARNSIPLVINALMTFEQARTFFYGDTVVNKKKDVVTHFEILHMMIQAYEDLVADHLIHVDNTSMFMNGVYIYGESSGVQDAEIRKTTTFNVFTDHHGCTLERRSALVADGRADPATNANKHVPNPNYLLTPTFFHLANLDITTQPNFANQWRKFKRPCGCRLPYDLHSDTNDGRYFTNVYIQAAKFVADIPQRFAPFMTVEENVGPNRYRLRDYTDELIRKGIRIGAFLYPYSVVYKEEGKYNDARGANEKYIEPIVIPIRLLEVVAISRCAKVSDYNHQVLKDTYLDYCRALRYLDTHQNIINIINDTFNAWKIIKSNIWKIQTNIDPKRPTIPYGYLMTDPPVAAGGGAVRLPLGAQPTIPDNPMVPDNDVRNYAYYEDHVKDSRFGDAKTINATDPVDNTIFLVDDPNNICKNVEAKWIVSNDGIRPCEEYNQNKLRQITYRSSEMESARNNLNRLFNDTYPLYGGGGNNIHEFKTNINQYRGNPSIDARQNVIENLMELGNPNNTLGVLNSYYNNAAEKINRMPVYSNDLREEFDAIHGGADVQAFKINMYNDFVDEYVQNANVLVPSALAVPAVPGPPAVPGVPAVPYTPSHSIRYATNIAEIDLDQKEQKLLPCQMHGVIATLLRLYYIFMDDSQNLNPNPAGRPPRYFDKPCINPEKLKYLTYVDGALHDAPLFAVYMDTNTANIDFGGFYRNGNINIGAHVLHGSVRTANRTTLVPARRYNEFKNSINNNNDANVELEIGFGQSPDDRNSTIGLIDTAAKILIPPPPVPAPGPGPAPPAPVPGDAIVFINNVTESIKKIKEFWGDFHGYDIILENNGNPHNDALDLDKTEVPAHIHTTNIIDAMSRLNVVNESIDLYNSISNNQAYFDTVALSRCVESMDMNGAANGRKDAIMKDAYFSICAMTTNKDGDDYIDNTVNAIVGQIAVCIDNIATGTVDGLVGPDPNNTRQIDPGNQYSFVLFGGNTNRRVFGKFFRKTTQRNILNGGDAKDSIMDFVVGILKYLLYGLIIVLLIVAIVMIYKYFRKRKNMTLKEVDVGGKVK